MWNIETPVLESGVSSTARSLHPFALCISCKRTIFGTYRPRAVLRPGSLFTIARSDKHGSQSSATVCPACARIDVSCRRAHALQPIDALEAHQNRASRGSLARALNLTFGCAIFLTTRLLKSTLLDASKRWEVANSCCSATLQTCPCRPQPTAGLRRGLCEPRQIPSVGLVNVTLFIVQTSLLSRPIVNFDRCPALFFVYFPSTCCIAGQCTCTLRLQPINCNTTLRCAFAPLSSSFRQRRPREQRDQAAKKHHASAHQHAFQAGLRKAGKHQHARRRVQRCSARRANV